MTTFQSGVRPEVLDHNRSRCLAIFLSGFLTIAFSGCDGAFQISGSVSDQDSEPIEGAEIVLIDETGEFSTHSIHSRADGTFFSESSCAPNPSRKRPVTIKCSKPGFTSFHSSGELNDVTNDYKIILKRPSPESEN
ncbi:MAG: hypothetical protein JNL58_05630 [Planctomyces sp.]|nr:hypothetical protein [Planctomyces sp.]